MKAELLAAIPSLRAFAMSLSGNIDRAEKIQLSIAAVVTAETPFGSFEAR